MLSSFTVPSRNYFDLLEMTLSHAYYRSYFLCYLVFQIDLLEMEHIRRLTTFKIWIHTADFTHSFISALSIF